MSSSKGWRNIFTLPISYDVNMIPTGTLLIPSNLQLLESTGIHPEGYNTRFAVVDEAVNDIYGEKIHQYFVAQNIELTTIIIPGGEPDKRSVAVDKILDAMCAYKLRRREPFLAIGGGVVLDIAGMAACLYRRGVPFVRVPTTLLAIVDASVGVKNGVDYCCQVTDETYKNRVGSFYAPSSCLLDTSFIATQDKRNISNGFGEILKLALVRSVDLFELLETHGSALVESRFADSPSVPDGVQQRIIDVSIQIMLEELGPNLWEQTLERCVDYGHTFSKLLEMVPGVDIMHGEAVNIDGFFCCLLSYLRGFITMDTVNRVFQCMQALQMPTTSSHFTSKLAWQSCKDAVEHRHGAQRIPLLTEIGDSVCVSDVTSDELDRALELLETFKHVMSGE
ncbi:3-dehydroquinate synthase [Fragilariopsis cylindrus CCMP1102]|uniref:3-dehydroquinate synthase n=1 Tax=Fragilariopsis cylindrus CCMP1102 TaxID=635003 RepID=A0A1E7FU15_9STRA|nr:3-dehydroquinate synthase [Fragilariopsis cylindrus CCMP1102]|eukprot:OEU21651.1 3-dehydroquinate synthase [Fragilariopsis cylindrus CCMP1102]